MTTELMPTKDDLVRDLAADLKTCDRASPGPWVWQRDTRDMIPRLENEDGDRKQLWWTDEDEQFCAAARTGWPAAIRRALAAERERDEAAQVAALRAAGDPALRDLLLHEFGTTETDLLKEQIEQMRQRAGIASAAEAESAHLRTLLFDPNSFTAEMVKLDSQLGVLVSVPHWAAKLMAESFVESLSDALNFMLIELTHHEAGPILVTVRRKDGESPESVLRDLQEENARLSARVAELFEAGKEAHGALVGAHACDDSVQGKARARLWAAIQDTEG
jgi:hypothetical protein